MKSNEAAIMERRRSKRWNLKVPLRIFRAGSEIFVGHVLDASLHGIKVASDYPFEIGQEQQFDIEIPDKAGQWRLTTVTAHSVYSMQETNGNMYYTGFQFVHVEPESLLSLQKLIDDISSFS